MAQRIDDYFAEEAREYLEDIEVLVLGPATVAPDQFLRLATGVRGSARMARADAVADLAEHLEDLGRSLRSGVASWDDELRALVLETVGELRALLDAVDTSGAEEEERARRMHARWLPEGEDEARSATSREPEPVPISALFFDDEGPHIVQGPVRRAPHAATAEIPTMGNGPVVPIQELLFRGHAALREAISLRPRFESLARGDALPGQELPDLVRELFDLVELGMTDDSRSE